MIVAITGASGFIGRALAERLRASGHTVVPISLRAQPPPDTFAGCNAVVHLAGEPVAQRWTKAARERIERSRVLVTRSLVEALRRHFPQVLISASAIGYYGARGDEILTEASPPGTGFLAQVTLRWEQEARAAEQYSVRVVTPRIGIVLGRGGGALPRMAAPFRVGLGGQLGNGKQWMSWIHLDDLISLIEFAMNDTKVRGAINAVAPNPVINAAFTRELAAALHRPALLPVPSVALKLLLGEMSSVILGSQRVVPEAAQDAGFAFRYAQLTAALQQILAK